MEYNVGDKVILNGKETEIISTAYDNWGKKIYGVNGSMKDYYASDFEVNYENRN